MATYTRGFTFGVLLLALSACGRSTSRGGGEQPFVPPVYSLNPPADHYFIADPECLSSSPPLRLTKTTIRVWDGPEVIGRPTAISTLRNARSLVGEAISGTYFDRRYHRNCGTEVVTGNSLRCVGESGQERSFSRSAEEHNLLPICKDNFAYDKNSYEGIALTAASFIEAAALRIRSIAPQFDLGKIELEVLPIFKSHWDDVITATSTGAVDSYFVDNMAYLSSDELHLIALFPERRDPKSDQSRYWESAFAVSHEYGHHFQGIIAKHKFSNSYRLHWNPAQHRIDVAWQQKNIDAATAKTGLILSQLWTSIYESSADLFAYYTLDADNSSLIGLNALGINRNVALSGFADTTPKILHNDAINQVADVESCSPPTVLCSAHNIGAIIAHAFDQVIYAAQRGIYGEFTKATPAQIDERMRAMIAWYADFIANTPLDKRHAEEPKLFYAQLSKAFASGLQTLLDAHAIDKDTDAQKRVQAAVCERFAALLPAVPTPYPCPET